MSERNWTKYANQDTTSPSEASVVCFHLLKKKKYERIHAVRDCDSAFDEHRDHRGITISMIETHSMFLTVEEAFKILKAVKL